MEQLVGDPSPSDAFDRIDTTRPSQARAWNYWLGGKDYYPVDKELADMLEQTYPGMQEIALHTRAFLRRAVRHLAEREGIRQFLDIGTGLPTVDNTHEVAQRVDPASRIVYVDNDPVVLVHARALLTSHPDGACDYLDADVRDPDDILGRAARTLDFTEPIALLMLGVMGTVRDDDEACALIGRYLHAVPAGSFLVVEDGTNVVKPQAAAQAEQLRDEGQVYSYELRTPERIARFFDGLELLEPGVVSVSRWRYEGEAIDGVPDEVDAFGGMARKS
ncbi:SAM-dependent methyltransferase [Nonomuraea fuscirosea]|uniref:SAM-dependent methyltransferase n=1 Tax=Nonomuraea fuscirosea TaxID=1291556 RepID=UPI002DDBE700|nr:SAM-dependent methyltransferase [Nonomuraea fuscirosea]WSA48569.1 SAM-dependent methyltransferase [Nonomuraea fuscirosea]